MAYGTPSDPVAGTVITVAYAVANMLDPIRWLRLMTGNAVPPGSSYVVVSDSTTGTTWRKIPADALATGAVVAHLGYTPANAAGQTFTGAVSVPTYLTVRKIDDAGNGGRILLEGGGSYLDAIVEITLNVLKLYNNANAALGFSYNLGTGLLSGISASFSGIVTALGGISSGPITATSVESSTYLKSDVATGTAPLQVSSTTQVANLNASKVAGRAPGTADGDLAFYSGGRVVAASTADVAGNASQVAGKTPTATPAAGALPLADGSGKLDAWVTATTPGAYVPSGLVAMFRTAAAIASGWARETNLDGRIPVGAGTTFGITFAEGVNSGSSWGYTPSGSVAVVTGGPSATNSASTATGGGTHGDATDTHTHSITSQTFTGDAVNTYDHMALRCYVFAIKT